MAQEIEIILIAAIGKNRELGKAGNLLWRIPDDLKRFKEVTSGHPIIMGRKTYKSIGRPLPNRTNIIVTRDKNYAQAGCTTAHSVEDALEKAKETNPEKIFIIGGGEIYTATLPYATTLDLTIVDAEDAGADTFFPEFKNDFEECSESACTDKESPRELNGVMYNWTTYHRKNASI